MHPPNSIKILPKRDQLLEHQPSKDRDTTTHLTPFNQEIILSTQSGKLTSHCTTLNPYARACKTTNKERLPIVYHTEFFPLILWSRARFLSLAKLFITFLELRVKMVEDCSLRSCLVSPRGTQGKLRLVKFKMLSLVFLSFI